MPHSRIKRIEAWLKKQNLTQQSLHVNDWMERDFFWLKASDIQQMKPGEQISLLFLDRNVLDLATSANKENQVYTAKHFFRDNYQVQYTHKQGLTGTLKWLAPDTSASEEDFTFDVLLDHRQMWYPFDRLDHIQEEDFAHKVETGQSNPFVGWRGAAVPLAFLPYRRKVYWGKVKAAPLFSYLPRVIPYALRVKDLFQGHDPTIVKTQKARVINLDPSDFKSSDTVKPRTFFSSTTFLPKSGPDYVIPFLLKYKFDLNMFDHKQGLVKQELVKQKQLPRDAHQVLDLIITWKDHLLVWDKQISKLPKVIPLELFPENSVIFPAESRVK